MLRGGRRPLALALVALAAGGCGASPGSAQKPDDRPNVVVLMTDDQTLESMRVMPGVRRLLADRGTTFTRSFVSFALCCPSRATFLTGQYAHNHGVLGNRPPTGGYGRLDRRETLPVWLRRAGYRTMHVGKFLNRYGQDLGPYHVPPGWDDWHGSVDPFTYEYYGTMLNENGVLRSYPSDYSTDLYAGRAEELIGRAAAGDRPFFLSVGFLAPHGGGPRELDDPAGLATPVPAPRHRALFVALLLVPCLASAQQPGPTPAVEVRGFRFSYGTRLILKDLDLSIRRRAVTARSGQRQLADLVDDNLVVDQPGPR